MKNMGLKELILINPVPYKRIETYALAKRSRDIIDKALVYDDLQEALKPFSFVVGTTQRVRGRHYPLYTPQEVVNEMKGIGKKKKIALVFGRESRGLTNEELRSCHILSTIPTAVKQPAVNLAQSVMIYCYELYRQRVDEAQVNVFTWDLAENREIYYMYQHLESCLDAIEFHPRVDTKDFIDRFRRILGRVKLERRDLKLFHKLFSEVERALKQLPQERGENL
jgi:TrmH family RNA methyltransferase